MSESQSSRGGLLLALVGFALMAAMGVVLLVATLVVWLSALLGSMVWATLAGSLLCFVVAALIYFLSLRTTLQRLQEQMQTVYQVAEAAKEAYAWVMERGATMLLRAIELFQGKRN